METKICRICNIEKNVEFFGIKNSSPDKLRNVCKECRKIESKLRYQNNKEYFENYRKNNNEKIKQSLFDWRKNNTEKIREYNEKNREKLNELARIKRQEKKGYLSDYYKKRYKNNVLYSLRIKLGSRLNKALKKNNFKKNYTFYEILGCDLGEFKLYLENKFTEGMSWDLMGKEIHIDHIIPCASAKNEKELIELFHYTNLQPLWAMDNIKKSDKII